jgi:dihydroneopterin aldolase
MARDKVSSGPKTVTIPSSGTSSDKGDRIFLHGLAVECIIGFIEWERRTKQTIVLDVEMPVDCARAAASDDVSDTLDYKKVAKRLIAFVSTSEFKLVETLAHRAAMLILEEFSVDWVRLSVNKPGAIRHSKDVGVAVLRTARRSRRQRRHMTAPKPGHVRVFVAAGSNVEPEKNLARACARSRTPGPTRIFRAPTAMSPWASTDPTSSTWWWASARRSRWNR